MFESVRGVSFLNAKGSRWRPAIHLTLGLALVASTGAGARPAATVSASMSFVFVHGAWGGGWQFAAPARLLEAAGHTVVRPSLTGLGDRAHLNAETVDLDTHIEDIVATIEMAGLNDVVLVAHSYGGMVAMGVLDAIPERIRSAVFVDAFVPHDGESMAAILGLSPDDAYQPAGLPAWQFAPPGWDPDAPDPKLVPQSLATTNQPIALRNSARAQVPTTYLLTYEGAPESDGFAAQAERARRLGWRVENVSGDHILPWSDPATFVAALLRTVEPQSDGEETLRVVAYNLHHGEGMDARIDLERIAALIAELEPDLVALQEIDEKVERTGFVDQAAVYGQLTGLQHRFGEFMPYQGGRYGMAVLSRWPIVSTTNHRLPDGDEPRSALAIRVRSPHSGRHLEFVGIHLYRTEAERLAQAETLLEIYRDPELPVILAGDFNSLPGSPVMARIATAWRILDKGADRFTFPSTGPEREIDFFAVRPGSAFRVVSQRLLDEPVASDHRPLFVELAWPITSTDASRQQ